MLVVCCKTRLPGQSTHTCLNPKQQDCAAADNKNEHRPSCIEPDTSHSSSKRASTRHDSMQRPALSSAFEREHDLCSRHLITQPAITTCTAHSWPRIEAMHLAVRHAVLLQ